MALVILIRLYFQGLLVRTFIVRTKLTLPVLRRVSLKIQSKQLRSFASASLDLKIVRRQEKMKIIDGS